MVEIIKWSIGTVLLFAAMVTLLWIYNWVAGLLAIIVGLILVSGLVYLFLAGFTVIPSNKRGVKYWFGQIKDESGKIPKGKSRFFSRLGLFDSGPIWTLPVRGCGVHQLPKDRFELDYKPRVVYSSEDEDKYGRIGVQTLIVDCTVYAELEAELESEDNDVGETAKRTIERGVPLTEKGLVAKTDSVVDGAVRDAAAKLSWEKLIGQKGRETIKREVAAALNSPNSYFSLGGFIVGEKTGTLDINLKSVLIESKKLQEMLTQPAIQRLAAKGAAYEARRIMQESEVVADISKQLQKKGKYSRKRANEIAHAIYELQVTKDLQKETGQPVVKLIRIQSNSSVSSLIGEGMAAFAGLKDLNDKTTTKKRKSKTVTVPTP